MPEAGPDATPADRFEAALAALRDQGAERVDPLRFHIAAALARRARDHDGVVRERLDARLATVVSELGQRCAGAEGGSQAGVMRESPLAALLREVAGQGEPEAVSGVAVPAAPPELKALRQFRGTWARLSVERQVAQAREQAPRNAGPLNSHGLVLQAVELMAATAPDYLARFMSYADALLWLDEVALTRAEAPRSAGRGEAPRRRRAARPQE